MTLRTFKFKTEIRKMITSVMEMLTQYFQKTRCNGENPLKIYNKMSIRRRRKDGSQITKEEERKMIMHVMFAARIFALLCFLTQPTESTA